MDLMCIEKDNYLYIGSWYFIGYGCGIIFFFLPDFIGRKKTMTFILPLYIVSCYISIFPKTILIKKIGFWMQGLFHLKISLSYTSCIELVPENYKNISSTIISAFDASTITISCLIYKFYTPNQDFVYELMFYIGSIACIMYILIVPESPRWVFMNKGSNS
jgi:MFS family permease